MVRWLFARRGFLVQVEAEEVILQAITAHVSPYLHVQALGERHPDGVWAIKALTAPSPSDSPGNGSERLCYDEPFAWVDPTRKIIAVGEATERLVVQRIIRLLRNLFRLLVAPDALFVHGGMIEVAGRGIAFLGAKYAGKTSSILAALTQTQAAFVENDSLSLHMDTHPSGWGWFRSIYIRRDVPPVLARQLAQQAKALKPLEQTRDTSSLSPQDFATTFGCTLLPQAVLHLIILPSFLPRDAPVAFSLSRLSKEEARGALTGHLIPVPNEYHQFLRPFFPAPPDPAPLLEKIVQHVPCYHLEQSFLAIAPAARAVVDLARAHALQSVSIAKATSASTWQMHAALEIQRHAVQRKGPES